MALQLVAVWAKIYQKWSKCLNTRSHNCPTTSQIIYLALEICLQSNKLFHLVSTPLIAHTQQNAHGMANCLPHKVQLKSCKVNTRCCLNQSIKIVPAIPAKITPQAICTTCLKRMSP